MREAEVRGMPDGEDSTHDLESGSVLDSQREEGEPPTSKKRRAEESMISWEDRVRRSPDMQFEYFEDSIISEDWELCKKLIPLADEKGLNNMLLVSLYFIWVLKSAQGLNELTGLIKEILSIGSHILTPYSLSESFNLSCVLSELHRVLASFKDESTILQRFEGITQEFKVKMAKFDPEKLFVLEHCTIRFATCIKVYMKFQLSAEKVAQSPAAEVIHRFSALKSFLDLAGDQVTRNAINAAFSATCNHIISFYDSLESNWASGVSARGTRELLGVLMERGAENVEKCFMVASCKGSIELVRILLQLAQQYNLDLDVDVAFDVASYFCMISTMQCLVDEWNATPSMQFLEYAAARGCMKVVQWYVNWGCTFDELSSVLVTATRNNQVAIVEYILPNLPLEVISAQTTLILKNSSPDVVAFLLRSNFVRNHAVTYATANSFAMSEDLPPQLRPLLYEHWTEAAFTEGMNSWREHYVNFMRVLRRGRSPIQLKELPEPLVAAILYLPLYQECIKAGGPLLPQRLRGQLVEAVRMLGNQVVINGSEREELLAVLENHLYPFLLGRRTV